MVNFNSAVGSININMLFFGCFSVIHDYIMLPPTILTFTGNMRFQTFGLTLVSDTIPEQVETIIINITDVVITFNGGQVLLTQQERNRIKFPRDHARVSIYDTCSKLI